MTAQQTQPQVRLSSRGATGASVLLTLFAVGLVGATLKLVR